MVGQIEAEMIANARARRQRFYPEQPPARMQTVYPATQVYGPSWSQRIAPVLIDTQLVPPFPRVDRRRGGFQPMPSSLYQMPEPEPVLTTAQLLEKAFSAPISPLIQRTAHNIVELTAEHFQVPVVDILGPRRQRTITTARQTAIWRVAMARPDYSLPRIASLFGGRDHTTILHAVRKIDREYRARGKTEYIEQVLRWSPMTIAEAARHFDAKAGERPRRRSSGGRRAT